MTLSLCVALLVAAPDARPTYARDIAPIFQRRCQDCHRPGEVAPMSLLSYEEARPWARSIKRHVLSRGMPPWHADPAHGKFANDPRLGEAEIKTIGDWVDAGAPEGDAADHPPAREFVDGWVIGTPDAVFTMPQEYRVPAEGTVPYQYFTIPTGFTEDRWVQAAEVRPGNRAVVHHIIVFVLEPGSRGIRGNVWQNHLCGTAPGEAPDVFPPGTGKRIQAGSQLLFQVHYTPNGTASSDRSQVGLIFAREPVRPVYTRTAWNLTFRIPPGAPDHPVTASYTFSRRSTLLGLMPHMHLRGKSFRYELELPGGERETLLWVPRWDFNWQHHYILAAPRDIPAGSTIHCTARYDNSKDNPANPDPTATVRWGDQTWEEMMIGFITFIRPDDEKGSDPLAREARAPAPAPRE
jgi:hypothetical protein